MWKNRVMNRYELAVWLLIGIYILYFSIFTILRYHHLYAHYFDLGIMHQTVYNTFQALKTGDLSRVLELTTPHGGGEQIKRMAIHNDIFLALLAPFYFIYAGPETLLVIQALMVGLGAWAVFKSAQYVLKHDGLAVSFAFAYLMYPPLQRANIFEFHPVVLGTSLLLYMIYFWLIKKYRLSFLFLILSLITKEQVGLTTGLFGAVLVWKHFKDKQSRYFASVVMLTSWVWVLLSVKVIIPSFRTDSHFAEGYYQDWLLNAPGYIFHSNTYWYLFWLLGPFAFLSLFAPLFIFIAGPEFGINLLSSNWNLRKIIYQYTAIITPWLVIAAIFGAKNIKKRLPMINKLSINVYLSILLIVSAVLFGYLRGPLPYSREKDINSLLYDRRGEYEMVKKWVDRLDSDSIKVSSSGQIGPFFTSRRYFYNFSDDYQYADYVIISLADVQNGFEKEITRPAYERLKRDERFEKIDEQNGYEVYKHIRSGS